jgi:hypothetical protein
MVIGKDPLHFTGADTSCSTTAVLLLGLGQHHAHRFEWTVCPASAPPPLSSEAFTM